LAKRKKTPEGFRRLKWDCKGIRAAQGAGTTVGCLLGVLWPDLRSSLSRFCISLKSREAVSLIFRSSCLSPEIWASS
jgi:hypothetical protein